ncbi:DegT/DnrJ/EryC1/StrS family aminotransferase, partial [Crocinitomicaceae bacterium]|nr:DegT/DnrJ/EryC1/StrS family aminotransferase [Crocinitomicaceae bacterium]
QAIGAELNGVKSGAIGLASAFSFYPGKNLGAMGDGGAICTKDLELYQIIKAASNYGASNKYTHDILGDNCRLDEIQAAVLNIKLPHLNDENTKRRSIAKKYDEGIRNESIQLPKLPLQQLSHVWHLYVIQVENRNDFQEYMNLNGIETMIHYPIPIHKQQAYKKYNDINLINCETVQCKIVSIPLNSSLDHQSVEYIISTMNKYQIN